MVFRAFSAHMSRTGKILRIISLFGLIGFFVELCVLWTAEV